VINKFIYYWRCFVCFFYSEMIQILCFLCISVGAVLVFVFYINQRVKKNFFSFKNFIFLLFRWWSNLFSDLFCLVLSWYCCFVVFTSDQLFICFFYNFLDLSVVSLKIYKLHPNSLKIFEFFLSFNKFSYPLNLLICYSIFCSTLFFY
jgi:hypothetical protein